MANACFVTFDSDGRLGINTDVLNLLSKDPKAFAVVAIVGPQKTGKQVIRNALFGFCESAWFPEVDNQNLVKGLFITKAISHSTEKDTIFIISKGLFCSPTGPDDQDLILKAFAIAVSDVFILNTIKDLDLPMLQNLSQSTQVASAIKASVTPSSKQPNFPAFIWTVRDVEIKPAIGGRECSPGEVFEHWLKMQPGITAWRPPADRAWCSRGAESRRGP